MKKIHILLYLFMILLVSSFVSAVNQECSLDPSEYLFFDDFDTGKHRSNWTNMTTAPQIKLTTVENGEFNLSGDDMTGTGAIWVNLTEPGGELGHSTNLKNNVSIEYDFTLYSIGDDGIISGGIAPSTNSIQVNYFRFDQRFIKLRSRAEGGGGGEAPITPFTGVLVFGQKYHIVMTRNEIGDGNVTFYNEDLTEILGIANVSATHIPTDGMHPFFQATGDGTPGQLGRFAIDNFMVYNGTSCPPESTPSFINPIVNDTEINYLDKITMNITVIDFSPHQYIFSWNFTGKWVNDTPNDVPSDKILNTSKDIDGSGRGVNFCWRYWANDTSANVNQSDASCFSVSPLYYNCSSGAGSGDFSGTPTLNFTFFHAENNSQLKEPITTNIVFDGTPNQQSWNFSTQLTGRQNYTICQFPNGTIQQADVLIEWNWRTNNFNYNFDDTIFNNLTKIIKLFVSDGTSLVTFKVIDEATESVENALIRVQKYDVATNTYLQVEILNTNAQGEAVSNLILNTVFYRFVVEVDGSVLLTDGPTKITSTTRTLQVSLLSDFFGRYSIVRGISVISCIYNNASFNFKFEFLDPASEISEGCLRVTNRSALRDVTVGDNCVAGTSGTVLVGIGNPSNYTNTFIGNCYVKFSDDETAVVGTWTETFRGGLQLLKGAGTSGWFYGMIIVITMFMVGIASPSTAIALSLVGFTLSAVLGLFQLTWGWIISLVIIGIIFMVKAK